MIANLYLQILQIIYNYTPCPIDQLNKLAKTYYQCFSE